MNRIHTTALVASFAFVCLSGTAMVGCSDVGDDNGAQGGDGAADAAGFDGTSVEDAEESETGSDASGGGVDGAAPSTGPVTPDSSTSGNGAEAGVGPESDDSGGGTGMDATMTPGMDATVAPGVDAGNPGVDAGMGVDAGHPGVDAGTGIDAGAPGVDAGHDGGVVTTTDAGATSDGGACLAVCPDGDPLCPVGLTKGLGDMNGETCNGTEALLSAHNPDCLKCALNSACLHDQEGDDPAHGSIDCEDVAGNDSFNGQSATNTQACLDTLACELTTKCGAGGVTDCYCGPGENSTTCLTTQTGACIPQIEFGLESTDPTFIQSNITATANNNGGSVADAIISCLHNNCPDSCF
jgi:hypothetical protein